MLSQFAAPVVGGEERAVQRLSRELAARRHDVAVATLHLDGTPTQEEVDGVRIHRFDSFFGRFSSVYSESERRHLPPVPDPQVTAGLRRLLAAERPDIVHAHNWIAHSLLPLHRPGGPPLVLTLHDYSLLCANKRLLRFGSVCSGPGVAKCLRCSADYYGILKGTLIAGALAVTSPALRQRVDMYLPVSEAVATALGLARHGLPFEVVPNLSPEDGNDAGAPVEREFLGRLPEGGFVLFLGDATEDKGAYLLLEAHRSLEHPLPLVFIGRPFDLDRGTGQPGVSVLGSWPHGAVLEALRRCSMLVSPSLAPETFGMAALEAMSYGRPVVASAIGGLPELVVDGVTGVLVPPGDVRALADALAGLAGDPRRREALGRAGKARAALYSAENVVPRLERVYGSLLGAERRVGVAGGEG